MNSDEYHAIDEDEEGTRLATCHFCGLNWNEHTRACPCGGPDDYDDPAARGREEDRVYQDLRERWTEGP